MRYVAGLFLLLILKSHPAYSNQTLVFVALGEGPKYVLQEAYRRLNLSITIELMPAGERALWIANQGIVDGDLIRIANIQARYPNLLMVPTPVYYIEQMVFSKQQDFPVQGWNSLRPYNIGILIGMKIVEDGTKGMTTIGATSYEQLMQLVNLNRVDIGILPRINILMEMKRMQRSKLKILEPPVAVTPLYHYLHKKHHTLVPKLNQVLQAMEQEGIIKKLINQFFVEATQ
ncbi:substrate-binding periplasmic protein [Spartinivicinus poritis]|uniref:Transporter substrate-binding domain-containing protein n=1 Tax=Spartinivicinus poritis TaxID=2994640 RepID=A0ABT5U3A8_9GAMM|nr:transporter substrate-binding domain-containing protein [Spartinivicinus sp. A2-2]MDE1460849.1 transporter substrate-binding domain-containing protein [Spartinivicinus sp. A2-2]